MSAAPSSDAGFGAALISVRIVDIDYYMMALDKYSPAVAFQAARLILPGSHSLPKLPTIRIFGSTPAGQKACIHLHGLRPYFYVRLPDGVQPSSAVSFAEKLKGALDQALSTSLASSIPADAGEQTAGTRAQSLHVARFVCDIEPVLRTDIYGFGPEPTVFLRIMLYNPRFVSRLATILYTRAGLPDEFSQYEYQPYESHMSFTLQVLTDLALTGMGYINISTCRFRLPLPPDDDVVAAKSPSHAADPLLSIPSGQRVFTERICSTRPDLFWTFGSAERRTFSELEIDAFAVDVLNNADSSQDVLPGQKQGPDSYAAKTLRVLWDEERARIGRKPIVPLDLPRIVAAGHHLSHDRLSRKIRALLDGTWKPDTAFSSESFVEDDAFEDVVRYLDSDASDQAEGEYKCVSDGSTSDGSVRSEEQLDAGRSDWQDIIESTQAHATKIPQGDGPHEDDLTTAKLKDGRKPGTRRGAEGAHGGARRRSVSRRRRRVGSYQKLEFRGRDAVAKVTLRDSENLSEADACCNDVSLRNIPHDPLLVMDSVKASDHAGTPESNTHGDNNLHLSRSERKSDVSGPKLPQDSKACLLGGLRGPDLDESGLQEVELSAHGPKAVQTSDEARHLTGGLSPAMGQGNDDTKTGPAILIHQQSSSREPNVPNRSQSGACLSVPVVIEGVVSSSRTPRKLPVVDSENLSPHYAVCVVPRLQAPSKASVLDQFGIGKVCPSLTHLKPFFSTPSDVPSRPVPGVSSRVSVGGVAGLESAQNLFVDDDLSTARSLSDTLTTARSPPSLARVSLDLRLRAVDSRPTGLVNFPNSKIDSAGRFVALAANESHVQGSATTATVLSADIPHSHPRQVRRLLDQDRFVADDDDSDESDAEVLHDSMGEVVEITSRRSAVNEVCDVVERPSSPKYDDRSFFPDTPWKARLSRSTASGMKESPILRRWETMGKGNEQIVGDGSTSNELTFTGQNLTTVVVEIVASCHGKRLPDPKIDKVLAVFACCRSENLTFWGQELDFAFVLDSCPVRHPSSHVLRRCKSEQDLFDQFAELVRSVDPDILSGFETQTASIGFLLERADALNLEFEQKLSRAVEVDGRSLGPALRGRGPEEDENPGARYFRRKGADVKIVGRHVLNVWRVVRKDVKLASYTLEGVAEEVLNVTISKHDARVVEGWIQTHERADRALSYLRDRTKVCLAVLDKLDILGRTGELARVYGIEFMSVITRGSQYRVESMLARVAHPRGFVLLAAQRDQVFNQPAVECQPLVMEPESGFYVDPVIVLDFQSLYPSMIIAHNLCFSTMLGNVNRINSWLQCRQLGVVAEYVAPTAQILKEHFCSSPSSGIFCSPNGEMFVCESHRRGVLPQMLQEVLQTRVMVKAAMKDISRQPLPNHELLKRLNARQFAAKMLANVTYGFAAASATGRMPCAGLADSIVQCGRDALERMIDYVQNELSEDTQARVLYGDTDSLFVIVPGATRAEAFAVGRRITAHAEAIFPTPVKLQLEKVFHPCFLVTKKRYVGYAYDSETCASPVFDAKGIEIVRRDSCGIVQKTMEKSLRMLFEVKDVSKVKRFFQRTCHRIQRNSLPLSEFIFRKEVRLGTYKKTLPPAAVVASRAIEADPRASPRYGERVAFVVVFAGPGATLNDSVLSPSEMLAAESSGNARLHSTYYITKQLVPALDRLFCLLGTSVSAWYAEMPRASFEALGAAANSRIPSYFASARPCVLCRSRGAVSGGVCASCRKDPQSAQASLYLLTMRQRAADVKNSRLLSACILCVGRNERDENAIACVSLDCRVRFARHRLALQSYRDYLAQEGAWD